MMYHTQARIDEVKWWIATYRAMRFIGILIGISHGAMYGSNTRNQLASIEGGRMALRQALMGIDER